MSHISKIIFPNHSDDLDLEWKKMDGNKIQDTQFNIIKGFLINDI